MWSSWPCGRHDSKRFLANSLMSFHDACGNSITSRKCALRNSVCPNGVPRTFHSLFSQSEGVWNAGSRNENLPTPIGSKVGFSLDGPWMATILLFGLADGVNVVQESMETLNRQQTGRVNAEWKQRRHESVSLFASLMADTIVIFSQICGKWSVELPDEGAGGSASFNHPMPLTENGLLLASKSVNPLSSRVRTDMVQSLVPPSGRNLTVQSEKNVSKTRHLPWHPSPTREFERNYTFGNEDGQDNASCVNWDVQTSFLALNVPRGSWGSAKSVVHPVETTRASKTHDLTCWNMSFSFQVWNPIRGCGPWSLKPTWNGWCATVFATFPKLRFVKIKCICESCAMCRSMTELIHHISPSPSTMLDFKNNSWRALWRINGSRTRGIASRIFEMNSSTYRLFF